MPVSFLSTTQRERYDRYPELLSTDELARCFHLDDDDREWIATKRRDSNRLGYALQLTTVRFLGAFLEDPTAVPPHASENTFIAARRSRFGRVHCSPTVPPR